MYTGNSKLIISSWKLFTIYYFAIIQICEVDHWILPLTTDYSYDQEYTLLKKIEKQTFDIRFVQLKFTYQYPNT